MKKIGLISDPHAISAPVAEALAIFAHRGVDVIWCTGDIAGYNDQLDETVALLAASGCSAIAGNHERWYLEKHPGEKESPTYDYIQGLPLMIQATMDGISLYMVHASPPQSVMEGIRLLDQQGHIIDEERQDWTQRLGGFSHDVLIVGHTHQVFSEWLGDTLVINPGSTCFNHCCAILSVPDLELEWFALSGQPISYTWNWGDTIVQQEQGK